MREEIQISQFWKCGDMLYNRECLSPNHPENLYNYVKRDFGVNPEDYGINHPLYERFKDLTREQLINKVCELEAEVNFRETYL